MPRWNEKHFLQYNLGFPPLVIDLALSVLMHGWSWKYVLQGERDVGRILPGVWGFDGGGFGGGYMDIADAGVIDRR